MTCPRCSETLEATVRDGVEIDHCPRCRGVWLDRGELDKLIGRFDGTARDERRRDDDRYDDDDDEGLGGLFGGGGGRRRGGLLGDLFDFG
jgi:Zn-finger nucleic acid-binding protein